MRLFVFLLGLALLQSCNTDKNFEQRAFSKVEIETILEDSLLSIRAIDLLDDHSLAFAANDNRYGMYLSSTDEWLISEQLKDTLRFSFRSVAHTTSDFFMLSIANPALLYKTTLDGMELVYEEKHENVFYDAMDFWNDQEGIAVGDPTEDCLSIIISRDGGNTWNKLSCDELPVVEEGEAAFAASNTNIAIVGDHTWVASGGMVSRIFYSPDKGYSWAVFDTPIIQGKPTTGMYSIDFYDELNGFAIGGDYTKPEEHQANKIITIDGGKSWALVGVGEEPGYRSCVQYIPNREGKELVAIGFRGIDYSNDGGYNWIHLSDESFYTLRFVNDSMAYAAGQGRVSKLWFRE